MLVQLLTRQVIVLAVIDLKQKIDSSKKYEVSVDYDSDGIINVITIADK